MRHCAMLAVLAAAPFAPAADDKAAVREIPTKDLKLAPAKGGKPTDPAVVASADDLAKNAVVAGAADELKKQVDFGKEKLVVFAWAGSGGDKVAGELKAADKKSTAVFTLTRGLTRDLRTHVRLFAVPKDAEVKVEAAK